MGIVWDQNQRIFTLQTAHSTYQMQVNALGMLLHLYYGKTIENTPLDYVIRPMGRGFAGYPMDSNTADYSLDIFPQEYPVWGNGDMRETCLSLTAEQGQNALDLRYVSYEILDQKPDIGAPMPHLYGENIPTLIVTMQDIYWPITVKLYYSVFEEDDAITRRVVIENHLNQSVFLQRALSMCLDFLPQNLDLISFPGSWSNERQLERQNIGHSKIQLDSVRGASSHHMNPFAIVCDADATEDAGDVYAMTFVYSGNFMINVQKDQADTTRFAMGISSEHFSYEIASGQRFETPEAILVYSDGFSHMSHHMHHLFRHHLIRGEWQYKRRPILINSWEACYFDFDGEALLHLAKKAADLGIEMLVMDDGWFGKRDDATSGLGDWEVNEEKLGMSLEELAMKTNALGLLFGIWIEPEMINEDSDLYRIHPDWAFRVGQRPFVRSRNQLVLNMARSDVVEYLYQKISKVLSSASISYVKWDMNRSLCDVWSSDMPAENQGELYHRYVLGVYELADRLTKKFPHILWEGCSGGGGRFDAGMLYYFPQIWCSDNTDAYARLLIQYGTSFAYPMQAMGSHVSICPNHQTGRTTPLSMRFLTAVGGAFGYEMNLDSLTEQEKDEIRREIVLAKKWDNILQNGEYYRLTDPFVNRRYAAWEFVDPIRENALVFFVLLYAQSNPSFVYLKVKGLDKKAYYSINGQGRYGGDALMNAGILLADPMQDYETKYYEIKRIL